MIQPCRVYNELLGNREIFAEMMDRALAIDMNRR
jgi:hypothetical protein